MKHVLVLLLVALASAGDVVAQVTESELSISDSGSGLALAPIRSVFVENQGQFQEAVKFRTALPWPVATITDEGLVLTLMRREPLEAGGELLGHTLRLRFAASATATGCAPRGIQPAITRCSYFLGSDNARWVEDVPAWQAVRFDAVVPGVYVDVHGRRGLIEYDMLVEKDISADTAQVIVDGADHLRLLPDGSLDIETPLGTIRQLPPQAWEIEPDGSHRAVESRVVVLGSNRFSFKVLARDLSRPVVIDPGLVYGSFVEGSSTEFGWDIAASNDGSAFISATTTSSDFPVTPGAFDTRKESGEDAVICKLSADGSALEYATYLGGQGSESPRVIAESSNGELLICGKTNSSDFPTTQGAYSQVIGGQDAFLCKLNATGTGLLFSTFFGGSSNGDDSFTDMAVDSLGRIVLSGGMEILDLPITPGAPQPSIPDPPGGFIARILPDGSDIDFCTYVGCTIVNSIAVDAKMAIYASGYVALASQGLPVTSGAFQTSHAGFSEAFALKLDASGALEWCSLLGGSDTDRAFALGVDGDGQAVVAGWTESFDFPTTPGSYDPSSNGARDAFVAKFASDGSSLAWGTRLGGWMGDTLNDMVLDAAGNCFTLCATSSPNSPLTPNGFDLVLSRNIDSHIAKLSADGTQLLYGSYLGGSGNVEPAGGIAVDPQGNVYVTGYTSSADIPTTPGAFDTELSGFSGIYVAKFDLSTWQAVGQGVPNGSGVTPRLLASGSLQPLSPGSLHVDQAMGGALSTLIMGLSELSLPFKGGTMVPMPLWMFPFILNAQGKLDLAWPSWPPGIPAGTAFWFQAWVSDGSGVAGFTSTNGLTATVPTP